MLAFPLQVRNEARFISRARTGLNRTAGVSLFVFCILANVVQGATTDTHLTFYIDNQPVGSFNHTPQSSSPTYEYNQMVYSNSSLDNTAHTFVMSNMGGYQYGQLGSLAMFDYAIYTCVSRLAGHS